MALRSRGRGHDVVLVHGLLGGAAVWEPVADRLAGSVRVHVPDLVGYGASPRTTDVGELWADAQADALAAALQRRGVARAAFVGHDFGGPVVVELWRRRPDLFTHLGVLATNLFDDTPIPLPISLVTWPLVGGVAERVLFSGPAQALSLRRAAVDPAVEVDAARWLGDGASRAATRRVFATALRELAARYRPLRAALATIDVPTLVGWGDRDPFFAPEQGARTARAIPGARLRTYAGAGHVLPAERPEEVARDVLDLVRGAPVAA